MSTMPRHPARLAFLSLAVAALCAQGLPAQDAAVLSGAASEAVGAVAPEPLGRPLRGLALPPADAAPPELLHQAEHPRDGLALPWGEPQFEKFRQAYLSPGGRSWISAISQRSLPYAAYIQERIRHYGVPWELFFLPFIESEYSPKAVSRSGAAGLWQFMKNSIGGYDMRISDWLDERRDFMKSTDGALRKLLWNYERFGDWLLAIAAYNCGAGAMDRAIAKEGVRDYWELRARGALPPETSSYIPKFLAVVSVAGSPGRHGIPVSWDPPEEWVRVAIKRPVDLGMLAAISGVSLETFKAGNPELRYLVTPPEGSYFLKVPAARVADVEAALASGQKLLNVYLHVVSSGDTVSAIARHYGVSIAMIVNLNPGLNPDRIRLGQSLAIPAFKDVAPYHAASDEASLSFSGSYTVRKGDTLWGISLAYGVQPETLAERNGLELTSVLREGSILRVPILEQ